MVHVEAVAPLRPTEAPERVEEAVTRFFPGAEAHRGEDDVRAVADDLGALRRRIWELRIIDTFRTRALACADGRFLRLRLSKQAAYLGQVSLPPSRRPHALGDLEILVEVQPEDPWDDAEALVWWLAPETKEGEVVGDI